MELHNDEVAKTDRLDAVADAHLTLVAVFLLVVVVLVLVLTESVVRASRASLDRATLRRHRLYIMMRLRRLTGWRGAVREL